MRTLRLAAPILLMLIALPPALTQERRPWSPEAPKPPEAEAQGFDAMAWERDFDLLLEVENIPTKGQLLLQARREALQNEAERLELKISEARKLQRTLETSYTSEALLQEMIDRGVPDAASVQKNLKEEIRRDGQRLGEIRAQLKRLDQTGGG